MMTSVSTRQRWLTLLFLLFATMTVVGGGSSRPDVLAVAFIRLGALVAVAAALLLAPADSLGRARGPALFALGCVALAIVQLVPLPPGAWVSLPGHDRFASVASVVGPIWRPVTLTPDLTWSALFGVLPPLAAAVAACLWRDTRIAMLLVGLAIASMFLGLLQIGAPDAPLRWYSLTSEGYPVGLLANRNHQAALIGSSLPLAAALLVARGGRSLGSALAILMVAAIVAVAGAALTGSRAGLLTGTLEGGAAFAILLAARSRFPDVQGPRRIVVAAAALALLASAALIFRLGGSVQRLATEGLSDTGRVAWLGPLTEMARVFFPFGSGLGSFDSVYRSFEPFELLTPQYLNAAHNDPLQMLIEGGVGALALMAIYLVWWLRASFHAWARQGSSMAQAGSVVTGALMLLSLVDYPLRTPLMASIFAVASVWLGRSMSKNVTLRSTNEALEPATGR